MGCKKPRKPRKGRTSEQCITRRGLRIYQKGDQIRALTGHRWDVASQSGEGVWYRVSFAGESPTCECTYHTTGKGCRCKHIAAVEHTLLISSEATFGKKVDIKEHELKCPGCKKKEYTRDGWHHGKHEKRQRYKCVMCGRRFRDNLGFEYRQVPRLYITLALMLSGMGTSAPNIQATLGHMGVGVHVVTITRTLEQYSELVQKYTETLKPPRVGDKWGCDEKHQKVGGKESYITAVMDLSTRFILAWDTTPTKEKYDAAPLLRRARDVAGRIPRLFITDGLDQYHIAFKKVFRTLKGLRSIHIRDIHIRNLLCNTNTYVNPVWSAEFSLASSAYLRGGIWAIFLNLSKTNVDFVCIVWYWIVRNIPWNGFPAAHRCECAASPNVSFCEGGDLIPSLAFRNKNIRAAPRCAGRMVPARSMM